MKEQILEDLAQESIQDLDDKWRRQLIDPRDVIEKENYCTNSSIQSLDFEYDERAVSMAQKEQITDVCGLFRQKFIDGLNLIGIKFSYFLFWITVFSLLELISCSYFLIAGLIDQDTSHFLILAPIFSSIGFSILLFGLCSLSERITNKVRQE